jgi:hypothetical protein
MSILYVGCIKFSYKLVCKKIPSLIILIQSKMEGIEWAHSKLCEILQLLLPSFMRQFTYYVTKRNVDCYVTVFIFSC